MSRGKILSYLKIYFTFSRAERNGIVVLMLLLGLIITGIIIVPKVYRQNDSSHYLSLQRVIDSLYIDVDTAKTVVVQKVKTNYSHPTITLGKGEIKNIELNTTDSASLIQLPGIGPVLASRIIKYRNLLGGFYGINQLKEVYGLKEEHFSRASQYLTVNSNIIIGISVDTASYRSLARHPYIGKERAWKIIDLRKRLSTPMSPDDIKNAFIFDSLQWKRIEPYLIFQKINRSEINK